MRVNKLFYTLFLLLSLPFHLLAWGKEGHQIVAKLAMMRLTESNRQKVLKVLGSMTPEEAATWMDDVRGDAAYKYMAPWHYTNIDSGASYQPAAGGDIITALNTAYNELLHMDTLSPERLRFDVLVLFHLCGDLMQPLHMGYGSDKGGNDYQVQFNGKGTNLHHLWDTDIIESQPAIAKTLLAPRVGAPYTGLRMEPDREVNFTQILFLKRQVLPLVYSLPGHKVDSAYLRSAVYVITQRLRDGGDLLAKCLNGLFSRAQNIPVIKESAGTKPQAEVGTAELLAKVPAEQAANYIGKKVSVCGKVYSANFQGGSGVTFINMGGNYPDNPFTAVIMAGNRSNFNYKPEEYLSGKTICVIGTVKEYKGKPEIVVESQEQILVQ